MPEVTGERVSTAEGGFGPTWQRHVAAYRLCAGLLPPEGRVLDLGCGVGHSFRELAPRETVGLDAEASVLEDQDRETVAADMRSIPFGDSSFRSVLAVQSIEHVPDAERVLAEVARVLSDEGVAVLVTPNRLTFGRPDEIIDPYHYVEYDSEQLAALCRPWFRRSSRAGSSARRATWSWSQRSTASSTGCSPRTRFGFGGWSPAGPSSSSTTAAWPPSAPSRIPQRQRSPR